MEVNGRKTTTDLQKLKRGSPFTWGEITESFDVGPYSISAFHPWKVRSSVMLVGQVNEDATEFHVWVDDEDTSRSFSSLDAALAGAMAYRANGPNDQAGEMFVRMLRVK